MASPSVAQRTTEAYLALGPENSVADEGDRVQFTLQGALLDLPVRITAGLPERTAGLPVGLPGYHGLSPATLPPVLKITKGASR
jgi:hypothetical protein